MRSHGVDINVALQPSLSILRTFRFCYMWLKCCSSLIFRRVDDGECLLYLLLSCTLFSFSICLHLFSVAFLSREETLLCRRLGEEIFLFSFLSCWYASINSFIWRLKVDRISAETSPEAGIFSVVCCSGTQQVEWNDRYSILKRLVWVVFTFLVYHPESVRYSPRYS